MQLGGLRGESGGVELEGSREGECLKRNEDHARVESDGGDGAQEGEDGGEEEVDVLRESTCTIRGDIHSCFSLSTSKCTESMSIACSPDM